MSKEQEKRIPKEQLIQEFADAYEHVIEAAAEAEQHGMTRLGDKWGPREIVAHMAGWEVMATVHIPHVAAGMSPVFASADETQQRVMNDAINTALVTLAGDQPLATLCGMLRQAYQRTAEILRKLDDTFFLPGEYIYERTKDAIEHCEEHRQQLVPNQT